MKTNVVSLIPQIELDIIEAYLFDKGEYEFWEYLDEAEVPEPSEISRLSVAVAQILLNRIQGTLPQTGWIDANNDARASRQEIKRHKDATKLSFSPRLICCINWADSGPGISWIEAYHITFIPGFEKYIVTSSRDGDDAWECTDHAIGIGDPSEDPINVSRRLLTEFWSHQPAEQARWAYLVDVGLIDHKTADEWANDVWGEETEEEADEP
jgi:hypothetical protein